MYLALAGFVASLVAHGAGFFGVARPLGLDPWPLHYGVFVVAVPVLLVMWRLRQYFPPEQVGQAAMRGCPPWMKTTLRVLIGYAFLSFAAFLLFESGTRGMAGELRGFSGHWLLAYFSAFAILYSASKAPTP